MKKVMTLILIMSTAALMAQPRGIENEDLAFIKDWQRTQSIEAVAQAAALSADQVTTLLAIKAEVEAIKADAEAQRLAFTDNLAVLAAEVRANIEANAVFSDEDRAALCEARADGRLAGKEVKMRIQLATLPLEGLLSDTQKTAIGEAIQANRSQGCRADTAPERTGEGATRGQGQGKGRGGEQGRQGKGKILKLLLSDAFLNYYQ